MSRQRQRGRIRERGSTTVAMLGVVMATVLALLAAMAIGRAHLASAEGRTAADLGALAGASAAVRGGDACRAAAEVVDRNAGALVGCRVEGLVVTVDVEVEVGMRGLGPFQVSARAGPASER